MTHGEPLHIFGMGTGHPKNQPSDQRVGASASRHGERLEMGCGDPRFNPLCPHDETPGFTHNPTRRAREIRWAGEHTRGWVARPAGSWPATAPRLVPCAPSSSWLPLTYMLCTSQGGVSLRSGSSSELLVLQGNCSNPSFYNRWAGGHVPRGPRFQLVSEAGGSPVRQP